jgi:DNA-binding XRE family transcriptional regulator
VLIVPVAALTPAACSYVRGPRKVFGPRLLVVFEMHPTAVPDRFARNLREQRLRSGLTQERLAYVCNLHRTEISLLERGEREPRLTTIVRLARGLDVAPAVLLDGVE